MQPFMGEDFLLTTATAKALFDSAKQMPIFDWHCHLSPQEIYEDIPAQDITQLWLAGDHYKWRAMRCCGVEERLITGDASAQEKFRAWAKCMPQLIGNPLYHWTHLELQRYFGISTILSERTADEIWQRANQVIQDQRMSPRKCITQSHVTALCTTDDPADDLIWHKKLAAEQSFSCKVLPAFRPDKALGIQLPGFGDWVERLEQTSDCSIGSYSDLAHALQMRIAAFAELGCRASDHAFTVMPPYVPATGQELDAILAKGRAGQALSAQEVAQYQTALLQMLAEQYAQHGWVMELHIGALRNNNTNMLKKLGPDAGYDSLADGQVADNLSRQLDAMEQRDALPRTVLFTLNAKDNGVLASMAGNFQSNQIAGKLQLGTAWWFNDHLDGMREQMRVFASTGAFGSFLGMITDSRSFLSYTRHEYFRRILCGLLGEMVEQGLYPDDMQTLSQMVQNISYHNAIQYFQLDCNG